MYIMLSLIQNENKMKEISQCVLLTVFLGKLFVQTSFTVSSFSFRGLKGTVKDMAYFNKK